MSELDPPASEGTAPDPPRGGSDDGVRSATDGGGAAGSLGEDAVLSQQPHQPEKRRGKRAGKAKGGGGSFLRELPLLLLIAFVLAFLLRTFVVQVFYIPSSSMEPTLQINDRMVVEKVTYRLRGPRRGEVAVFEGDDLGVAADGQGAVQRVVRGVGQFIGIVPANARDFVKRVVGLPGDEILIEDGQVFVNGESIEEPYVVYDDEADFGPVTVPEERLFFLGDNRPNSSDSRRGLGFVPTEQLVGRASVIIWPIDNVGLLTGTHHEVPDRGEARDPVDGDAAEGDDVGDAAEGEDADAQDDAASPDAEDDAAAGQREPQPAF